MSFTEIAPGAAVFLDANTLVYPPVMRKEECSHIQTKFMESLPLMRLMTGSGAARHVDRAWMHNLARSLGPDGLVYRARKPGEPWTALPLLWQGWLIGVTTIAW